MPVLTESTTRDVAWEAFYRRLRRCTPPQRPAAETVAIVRDLLGAQPGPVLLLGTTPELSDVAPSVIAADWSASAFDFIWPGRADGRHGLRTDWLQLPCADGSFSSVAGDGSLNCLEYPHGYRALFAELARVVRPGGRVALRVFVTPDDCEPLALTREAVMAGAVQTVSGLKWRLATGLCAARATANLPVRSIRDAFDQLFPDRAALARITGWADEDIAGFDALGQVAGSYSFPTVGEVLRAVPRSFALSLVPSGRYELAERCPLLVLDARHA